MNQSILLSQLLIAQLQALVAQALVAQVLVALALVAQALVAQVLVALAQAQVRRQAVLLLRLQQMRLHFKHIKSIIVRFLKKLMLLHQIQFLFWHGAMDILI